MIRSIRPRLTFANVTSLIALFIALGGTSYAALTLPKNSVGKTQLKPNAVTSQKVLNRSLKKVDFARGQVPIGARGPAGARGQQGPPGEQGPPGQNGSPDSPEDVLSKLKTVDGPGSELDADTLDGKTAADLVPLTSAGPAPAVPLNFYSYFMDTATTNRLNFGQMAIQAAGVAGQFRICGGTGTANPLPWVLYLNGVRSTGTVTGNSCTNAFDAGPGGEFRVTVRRSIVFGVHSGDSVTNENYNVYGFGQL